MSPTKLPRVKRILVASASLCVYGYDYIYSLRTGQPRVFTLGKNDHAEPKDAEQPGREAEPRPSMLGMMKNVGGTLRAALSDPTTRSVIEIIGICVALLTFFGTQGDSGG